MIESRVEDLSVLMERLETLQKETGDSVSLTLNIWLHVTGTRTADWEVWVAGGTGVRGHKGATAADALAAAEAAHAPIHRKSPAQVIRPAFAAPAE